MFELNQAEGGVEFAHLAVDAWSHHSDFIDEAEILQVVDALLGLGIWTDDSATLESVEYFGGVETKHGQVAMIEHAAAMTFDAKGMSRVVDDLEVVYVGNALNGIDISGAAVAVYRHDGGGLRVTATSILAESRLSVRSISTNTGSMLFQKRNLL